MDGRVARWYSDLRASGHYLALCRERAALLTTGLSPGARILEVAPGPGFQAIELARDGRFEVSGLDISPTFVALASATAREQGVAVDFRLGDAAELPYAAESFDLIVCQAAFKNFAAPLEALDEMYRVLRCGGSAMIEDLDKAVTGESIARELGAMGLRRWNVLTTRLIFRTLLRRRAYSSEAFERLIAASAFGTGSVRRVGISLEVRLTKATGS